MNDTKQRLAEVRRSGWKPEVRPRYPDVHVQLVGKDGNAYSILSRADHAMKQAGVPLEERKRFMSEAVSSTYDALLCTVQKWVSVS